MFTVATTKLRFRHLTIWLSRHRNRVKSNQNFIGSAFAPTVIHCTTDNLNAY